jgi:biofilm PGA synthesis N-glycosyltransferase PgaC
VEQIAFVIPPFVHLAFVTLALSSLVAVLLSILSFLLIWQFVGYPCLMALMALRSNPKHKDTTFQPFVSIIVPTYHEATIVKSRIENLLSLDYPDDKYEIIVVASASHGDTAAVVERVKNEHNTRAVSIRLVEETVRGGKACAVNLGTRCARGEIILVTDANASFDQAVLKELVPHFNDPTVGAVGGRYIVKNPETKLTSSTQLYWNIEYMMRLGESAFYSACLTHGEMTAWRKDLAGPDPKKISDDLSICVAVRRTRYKIAYEPNAIVYEEAPTTAKEQIIQRKKTAIGTLEVIFGNLGYLLVPADLYRLIIFPSHKTIWMLSPFFLLAIPPLYLVLWNPQEILLHMGLSLFVFVLLFVFLRHLNSILNKGSIGQHGFSARSLVNTIYYVALNEFIVLTSWRDFVLKRYSLLWEIVETNRQADAVEMLTEVEADASTTLITATDIASRHPRY